MMLLIDGLHHLSREGWKIRGLAGMGVCFVIFGICARCFVSPKGFLKINQVCSSITPKFPVSIAGSASKGGVKQSKISDPFSTFLSHDFCSLWFSLDSYQILTVFHRHNLSRKVHKNSKTFVHILNDAKNSVSKPSIPQRLRCRLTSAVTCSIFKAQDGTSLFIQIIHRLCI